MLAMTSTFRLGEMSAIDLRNSVGRHMLFLASWRRYLKLVRTINHHLRLNRRETHQRLPVLRTRN